uniref:F-box domain-containing protein n=1 Tax=Aegilops tauschii subsp. strangulata TaxID=200361 RepID=A0A453M4Y2_AEGTS
SSGEAAVHSFPDPNPRLRRTMPPAAALMGELLEDPFLRLSPELVEEVFFRLPPDEPACLAHASAVCKPWRRILADVGFRRRYRKFHGTPPVLGLFQRGDWLFRKGSRLVPTSALFPAQPDHPDWFAMDCRHGRALFARIWDTSVLMVLDPVSGHQRLVSSPYIHPVSFNAAPVSFSAAVLCAAQGCDHHGCQGGHFRLAVVTTNDVQEVTSGWLYSSETRVWSELTSVHHPNVRFTNLAAPSVLVGDALYFNLDGIIQCQLGTLCLSMLEKPIDGNGTLMATQDGLLGFAAVVDAAYLTLWSREAGPKGAMGWAKLRIIDLEALLPVGAMSLTLEFRRRVHALVISSIAEGTQIIFVIARAGSYMVDLESGRVRPVSSLCRKIFPYMSFYIPGTITYICAQSCAIPCYNLSVALGNME